MNYMRRCLLIISLFTGLARSGDAAPTLPDPGTQSTTTFTRISGDYGPRNFTNQTSSNTNPHVGIDYGMAAGAKASSVVSGNITRIRINGGDSYIQIDTNWEYFHMSYLGPRVQVSSVSNNTVLVFRENAGGPAVKVLGVYGLDYNDRYFDTVSGSSISVRTSVNQNEWMYSVRSDHLHLEYRNGLENPLKYVVHSDSNTPVAVLWPKIKQIGGNGVVSDLIGDVIYSTSGPLILQVGVDVTGDKDLDKVEISYAMEGDFSTTTLNGWAYEPAINRRPVYTTTGRAGTIYLKSTINPGIAEAAEEGVYPAKDLVSFDFFKYKWDTRALKVPAIWFQSAPLNSMAQYPDGRYMIQMGAMDITGHTVSTDSLKTMDNFRPYVESLVVKDLQGNIKYSRGWEFENNVLVSTRPETDEALLPGAEYTAVITFSEFVDFAWMQLGTTGPKYYPAATNIPALKKTVYSGNFLVQPGVQRDELRPFMIFGRDLGRNDALALGPGKRGGDGNSGFERTIDPLHELVRGDDGLMRGIGGEDRFHPLRIDAAPPEISWKDRQGVFANSCVDGAPERCGSEAAPFNINFNTVTFRYTDLGSGLKELRIYKENLAGALQDGSNSSLSLVKRAYAVESVIGMPDGKYVQVVTDNLGRTAKGLI